MMKKLLSAVLTGAAVLNLMMASVLPASAEPAKPSVSSALNDHLVVHYDFEGDTVEEALTDKATAGTVQDQLHAYSPDHKNTDPSGVKVPPIAVDSEEFRSSFAIDTEKGTARVLQAGAALQAVSSADTQSIYSRNDTENYLGTATWFVRFKLDDLDLASETRLVDMRINTKSGCTFSILVDATEKLYTEAARTADKRSKYVYSSETLGTVKEGEYINFVLVMETGGGNAATGSGYNTDIKYTPYIAYGNPTSALDWIALTGTSFVSFRPDRLKDVPLALFDRYDGAGNNNTSLTIDDVRLYNKGLTVEEMASVFAEGSFDTIHLVGSQTKRTDGENTFAVRFVAIADAMDVSRVGFEVIAKYKNGETEVISPKRSFDTNVVYSSIYAGNEVIRASELRGTYIVALAVENIPLRNEAISFEIRPYLLYGDTRVYGASKTVAYTGAVNEVEENGK